ncbi:MAG: L-threonylcarbamoyladenylate synthase [Candidatus Desulforudaceae bacterium]
MKTAVWVVDPEQPDPQVMARAGSVIRGGGLVAFPTETVYGLGADALNTQAVRSIFAAKGRPQDNPLIVHVGAISDLDGVIGELTPMAEKLIPHFWPGPLTLVLPKDPAIPAEVTAGLDTVGVRMPAHPVALALLKAAGVSIAAPSANASGRPSPTSAAHVLADLDGRIEVIIDAGPCPLGLESTVLDVTGAYPVILRPGGVTAEDIEAVLGVEVQVAGEHNEVPRAPGMKYRHYAPRAELLLVTGTLGAVRQRIIELAQENQERRVVVLSRVDSAGDYPNLKVVPCGRRNDPDDVAAGLYAALRQCDGMGADLILAEGIEARGLGQAVMNRLRKAAKQIIRVGAEE